MDAYFADIGDSLTHLVLWILQLQAAKSTTPKTSCELKEAVRNQTKNSFE